MKNPKRLVKDQDQRFAYDDAGNQTGLNWEHYAVEADAGEADDED